MIVDLSSIAGEIETDVCIIGAGAAGLTLVGELIASGLDIVVLESGGRRREPSVDVLNQGEAEGLSPDRLVASRARGLGGTTQVWPGRSLPLAPDDFERRASVPFSGWPFSYEALRPFYDRAEAFLAIPPGTTSPSCAALSPRPKIARRLRRRLKTSGDVRLVLHATVTSVAPGEVRAASLAGDRATVRARRIVLCAGGIENARLLLLSGLGGPQVGRFFQEHPAIRCGEIDVAGTAAVWEEFGPFYAHGVRYVPQLAVPAEGTLASAAGFSFSVVDETAPRPAAARLVRRLQRRAPLAGALRDAGVTLTGTPELASLAKARLLGGRPAAPHPHSIGVLAIAEQAPDPANRVELAASRDALGLPQARLVWAVGAREHETFLTVANAVAERLRDRAWFRPSPWLETPEWRGHVFDTFHHMGTTRISRSTDEGVVDPDLRLHDLPSIFVCGSSVFPTSGAANPTLTIIALAIRLADLLKSELRT